MEKMKNKRFSKVLVLFLAVMMVFTMMPSMAFAADAEAPVQNETLQAAKQEIEAAAESWGLSELKEDLTLPETTANGCEVIWSSSYPSYVSNAGVVKRPSVGSNDGEGELKATIYDKTESITVEFPFTVKAIEAAELEPEANAVLDTYLDTLPGSGEKVYGDLSFFEGKLLGSNGEGSSWTAGIKMPVKYGGSDRTVYVTVQSDDEAVIAAPVYTGSSYGKNGKIAMAVQRAAEDKTVKLTFTLKASTSTVWTVEKTVTVAAMASEAERNAVKAAAETALAAIEDYDGSNAEAIEKEAQAAQAAVDAAVKAGWTLEEVSTWENYSKLKNAGTLLEDRNYNVTLTIQGYNKGDLYPGGDGSKVAYFIEAQPFTAKAGWSVYDLLKAATEHYGMQLGGSSSYVSSIAGLAEKMLGSTSGWMYRVNNDSYINTGMGNYKIKNGDSVLIYYVKDWGSVPACSFAEIKEWAQGKESVNLLGTNDLETLEKDWAAAKAALDANTEWYSDLPMPVRGENNSRIVWKTSNPDVVAENGKVTRAKDAVTVTLTATLYQGSEKLTKTYDVKIGGTSGINVTVKIEGKDADSSLEPWTGQVNGGSVAQYDDSITYTGYGDYITPGHALMTRLKASDENFAFKDEKGLKTYSPTSLYASIGTLLGVSSVSSTGRYWKLQIRAKDGTLKYESNNDNSLYFPEKGRLADGDIVIFRYTAGMKALNTAISNARNLVENNYTAESYAVLKAALESAEALTQNSFEAKQEDVDAAQQAIENAIAGLQNNVDILTEYPTLLKNLAESEKWQGMVKDGLGVLALSREGLSMTENGRTKFINAADSDLKYTSSSRPTGDHMTSAIGMTALGYDLNYYVPQGGSKTAAAQMWQENFKTTNTSSQSVACWLILNRSGAYPENTAGDRQAVEAHLLSLFDESVGGWKYSSSYKTIDTEYTAYAILALADACKDETNANHAAAVEKTNKAVATLKANYKKSASIGNRANTAIGLLAAGEDPEAVKDDGVGIMTSLASGLLADRTGFTESTGYSGNTPLYVFAVQMYKQFKETGKAVDLNVQDSYPAEAKAALAETLAEVQELNAIDYTQSSYAPLAEAIEQAQNGLISLKTTAEQAAAYQEALKTAAAGLAAEKDTGKLEQTLAEAKAIDLTAHPYTENTKKALTDAITAAEAVLAEAASETGVAQSVIEEAEAELRAAIEGLLVEGEADIDTLIKNISASWTAGQPTVSDDWRVVDMAMLGRAEELFADEAALHQYVSAAVNRINPLSVTDYERVLLAVTALGIDGSKLYAYRTFYDQKGNVVTDLVAAIQAFPASDLSINGATFALLAYDSGEYQVGNGVWSRENLVQYLLKQQLPDGGWNLTSSGDADPDVTAMAVSALARYTSMNGVAGSLSKATACLSKLQDKNGKYASYNTINSNSSAMVVIALASLGKDAANDEDFVKWSQGKKNSALSGLLSFQISKKQFGYDNARTPNALSTEQGFRALAAYRSYLYAGAAVQPYAFGKPDAPQKWEEQPVAVGLEIVSGPVKTNYQIGETFDETGLSVKVTFSDGTVIEPNVKDLEIVGFDSSTSGSRTIKVKYQNAYATFTVTIENSGQTPTAGKVYLRVADPQGKTYFEKQAITFEKGETAFSVLGKAGLSYRPNWNTKYEGVYVEAIEDLGEFDRGSMSGWMYRVNGYFPPYSSSLYTLKEGDYVEWLYTRDLGRDIGNIFDSGEEVKDDQNGEDANLAQVKEQLAKISLTARSAKTAKKNVKVTLKTDSETATAIKEIQSLGYTVKYKFYRSTKKAAGYSAKLTKASKAYINTIGTKGSRYYYKARVLVYDQNGKLVAYSKLTQCKYAARIWTK